MRRKNLREKIKERNELYRIEEPVQPLTEEQKARNREWMKKHKPDFLKKNKYGR